MHAYNDDVTIYPIINISDTDAVYHRFLGKLDLIMKHCSVNPLMYSITLYTNFDIRNGYIYIYI